tara:strand:+ start:139 stop:444 length:306 start_codon:yes stop_codon:yes gene_type:complete
VKPKGKDKLLATIKKIINKLTLKAERGLFDYGDDVESYKLIYAIANVWSIEEETKRSEDIERLLDKAWTLYFFFKQNIDGKKTNYVNIVNKYSMYERINSN